MDLPSQRKFEERLDKRISEVQAAQMRASVATDASLHNIHTDVHLLAGRLLDVVQRLEDRLAVLVGRADNDGRHHIPSEQMQKDAVHDDFRLLSPRKSGHTSSVGVGPGAGIIGASGLLESGTRRGTGPNTDNVTVQQSFIMKRPGSMKGWSQESDQMDLFTGLKQRKGSSDNKEEAESSSLLRRTTFVDDAESKKGPQIVADATDRLKDLDTRIGEMNQKLNSIGIAVSTLSKSKINEGDEDDRKRLKEKLKLAIELDRRSRIRTIVSRREVWMEYIFGICSPDKRIGKRGSR